MLRPAPLLSALILTLLTACAKPTPYQAADDHGGRGYSEREIAKDQYRIGFDGNGVTTRKTVDLYLLYRAAEITKDRGFDYFIVGGRKEFIDPLGLAGRQSQVSFARRQDLLIGSGIRARSGEEVVDSFGAEIEILMQKGKKPLSANVYGADELLTKSTPAIIRPASAD